jgi:hypothetical protein
LTRYVSIYISYLSPSLIHNSHARRRPRRSDIGYRLWRYFSSILSSTMCTAIFTFLRSPCNLAMFAISHNPIHLSTILILFHVLPVFTGPKVSPQRVALGARRSDSAFTTLTVHNSDCLRLAAGIRLTLSLTVLGLYSL